MATTLRWAFAATRNWKHCVSVPAGIALEPGEGLAPGRQVMTMLEARALEGPLSAPQITHADIADFAAECVNLSREDAEEFREQVRRLREKLDKYASEHPDYGLIKTLLSGSLAKGTALKTLNDIDVAFDV